VDRIHGKREGASTSLAFGTTFILGLDLKLGIIGYRQTESMVGT